MKIVTGVREPMERGRVDKPLSDFLEAQGSFTSTLSYTDHMKLRSIVRKVHMKHYPAQLISDLECDRMIDAIAPGTAEYLIKVHLEGMRSQPE